MNMLSAMRFCEVLCLIVPSMSPPPPDPHHELSIHCFEHTCQHEELCIITSIDSQIHGNCLRHQQSFEQECGHLIMNNEKCVCHTQACVDHISADINGHARPPLQIDRDLQCGLHICHHDEGCEHIIRHDGILDSQCKKLHELHQDPGCKTMPYEPHACYCTTAACNQELYNKTSQTHQIQDLHCGPIICHVDEGCVHMIHPDGILDSHCKKLRELHHPHELPLCDLYVNPSIQLHECYCLDSACTQRLHSLIYGHQTHVTTNTGFQCGDHFCAVNQFCELAKEPSGLRVHFICLENIHPPDNLYCLPNPLTPHQRCYCDSRRCVDKTILFIMQDIHSAGIICGGNGGNDLHPCPLHQICEIRQERYAVFTRHCVNSHQAKECTGAPLNGEVCYCSTQQCVYDSFSDKTTTEPTTQAFTTAQQSPVPTTQIPSQSSPIATTTNTPTKSTGQQLTTTTSPLTMTTQASLTGPPAICHVCGDIDNRVPCYNKEVQNSNPNSSVVCPGGYSFCMTDVYQNMHGDIDIFKRCVTRDVCDRKWISESADLDYCARYGIIQNPSAHECHFCCQGDHCNTGVQPPVATLLAKTAGK